VRKKLAKKYGIEGGVPVVTSTEMPRKAFALTPDKAKNKASYYMYGTWSCLPATFGMHAASLVLNSLLVSARGEGKAFSALRAAAEAAAARH
jgi:tRNA A37 threonylcarbamoyladenosine dehydratase